MKTSTLLHLASNTFRAALVWFLTAVFPLSAQQYSLNVVGYADVSYPAGTSLVSNPLNAEDNSISNLFRGVPDGTVFAPWNRATMAFGPANTFSAASGWTDPGATLVQPDGGRLSLPSATTLSFAGDVMWASSSCFRAASVSVMSVIPEICAIGTGTPPDGTELCLWDNSIEDWVCYYYYQQLNEWVTEEFDAVTPEIPPGGAALVGTFEAFDARFRRGGGTPKPSVLLQGAQRNGDNMSFRFAVTSTAGFTLLRSSDLNSPDWTVAGTQIATPVDGLVTVNALLAASGMAFYKVASVASPNALFSPTREGSQFRFQFYGTSGTSYTVERAAAPEGAPWQNVTTVAGEGALITVTDSSATAAAGYYRLRF